MSLHQLEQKLRMLGTPVTKTAKGELDALEKVFNYPSLHFDTIPLQKWHELLGGMNTLQAYRQGKLKLDPRGKGTARLANYYRTSVTQKDSYPDYTAIQMLLDGTMQLVRWENDIPRSDHSSVSLSFQPNMQEYVKGKLIFDGRWFINATVETQSDGIYRHEPRIDFRAKFLLEINKDVLRNKVFANLLSNRLSEKADDIMEEKARLARNEAKAALIKNLLKGE